MTGLHAEVALVRGTFRLEVDLEVPSGRILAVLGPNGAGKSTLLRALAGLVPLTAGTIAVGGCTWDDVDRAVRVPTVERGAGVVFQDYRLFPHLSVVDNVAFSQRVRGLRRAPARQRARVVLERMGLAELAGRRPGQLSGGQAQRVALARALAAEPALLLLDEPLAALDARTRLQIRGELRHHLAGVAAPTVLVTHDPLEAMVLADRILVLEDGRVVQYGTPSEVARRPVTEYIARLVGLNLYAGTLTDPRRGRVELDGGGVLFAAGHDPQDLAVDGDVDHPRPGRTLVVLAPTAISLFTDEPDAGSARNTWAGRVAGLELLTDRVRVAVDGAPEAVVDITPAALTDLDLQVGSRVWLSAKATEVVAYPDPDITTAPRRPR